jgi:SAM-dependent methyltransferase
MKSKEFYDSISGIYGSMIDFQKNLDLRISAYKNIFPRQGKVADIGCGIGLDSIALATNGHNITAFDVSPLMIEETKSNATKYNLNIDVLVHSFETIPKTYYGMFSNVVSVGNTIAHLSPAQLKRAIKKIFSLLRPGGKVFLHILNYPLIIKESKRINNIAVRDKQVIIRFYDLGKKKIDFNILSFPVENPKEYNLVTTIHYPHSKKLIDNCLERAGFNKIKFSKNFNGESFNLNNSKDLFIEAIKK